MTKAAVQTLAGVTPNASEWIDTQGFNAAALVLMTGAVTDAGTVDGFTATLQHGDDTTTAGAADCVAADSASGDITLSVLLDTEDDEFIGALSYVGSKRYIRLNFVGTTGTAAVVNVMGVLGEPSTAETTFVGVAAAAT